MVEVKYVVTVPSGLDNIPAPSPEVVAYREELIEWSYLNGLLDIINDEDATVRTVTYQWIDQQSIDDFQANFGQGYVDYYDAMVAEIEAVPGTIERTVEVV
jgi:hypothetical protein